MKPITQCTPRSKGPYKVVVIPAYGSHAVEDTVTGAQSQTYNHKDALHLRDWLELRARGYVERREVCQ